jgi:multidrug resistance efflux pump
VTPEVSASIPIPLRYRWQSARLRILPFIVLGVCFGASAVLWKGHISAPTMFGQAEPVVADVSSYKPGVVAELTVTRFQRVRAGDVVGKILVTEPNILASSLAVIQSEIDLLRSEMKPVLAQQRNAINYNQLRLDWMRQRTQLATARVNLQLAETEYQRMNELFKDQIVAARVFDQAKANRDRLQHEVDELAAVVSSGEQGFQQLQLTNATEIAKVTDEPLRAAINVQEAKLRLTEAELSPRPLKAPIDGIVTMVYHRTGESVTAGQPIISISTLEPVRIVGYLRPPLLSEPKAGTRVEVRTRGVRRVAGDAKVLEVGSQYETIPPALLGPIKFSSLELGLPVNISLPANMKIRAGELVELTLLSDH